MGHWRLAAVPKESGRISEDGGLHHGVRLTPSLPDGALRLEADQLTLRGIAMGWTRRTRLILGSALAVVLLIVAAVTAVLVMRSASNAWYSTAQPTNPGASVVEAANAFIDALDDEQRSAAVYDFADPVRSNWSNLPVGVLDFDRNGLRVGDLDDEQTAALMHFLSAALSERGYAVTIGIVGADRELSDSIQAIFLKWSSENYWLAFFGEPSEYEVWGWQFGGHHLALNVTVADGRSYMSPTFLGVEPSSYTNEDGSTVSPLDPYIEAGLALFNSLDADTRRLATVATRPEEVWAGAGKDGFIPALEGGRSPTGANPIDSCCSIRLPCGWMCSTRPAARPGSPR